MANITLVHNAGDKHVDPIEELVADIKAGKMVVLMDDEDRENEGDLVCAAELVTPQVINFMAKYGRGLICLALTEARCSQLNLPLMVSDNRSPFSTNFTVSIEAAEGVTTGISAADRARTVQAAVKKDAKPQDLVQPGHIFPLMAKKGGVLVRVGQTEGSIDLAQLAGLEPAAVICEILKEDGDMARLPDLLEFSRQHGIKIGTIADLIQYRSQHERLVERVATRQINTHYGPFTLHAYLDKTANETHLALALGDIRPDVETLVRVHEPLSVMDLLDTCAGRHSYGVFDAMRLIAEKGSGVIVLLHQPESGADLLAEVTAEERGDRPAAKWDPRIYGIGAQILRDLNVGKMRLLARPAKMPSMTGFNLEVTGFVEPGRQG
jgi:3,4-dihydroxy 2-butanone 4-phosphate synthase / GTP cyclohydrolase II